MAKKFVILFFLIALIAMVQPTMAQGAAQTTPAIESPNKWIAIGCAFALAIAAFGCGIAQSIAIRSAADGVARNPGTADVIRGMLIIGLAFIESLTIYVLLIAFMLYFKWA